MQTRLVCKLIKLQPQSIDLHPMARLRDGKSYHLSPPTPWLDATGFGRSRTLRLGVGGAGDVLRASDGCEGELVGFPIFLVDDAVPVPPWWWGWGVVQVLVGGSEVGLPAVPGPFW
jgi:hypothetical protein